jgi:hypothetical protein
MVVVGAFNRFAGGLRDTLDPHSRNRQGSALIATSVK